MANCVSLPNLSDYTVTANSQKVEHQRTKLKVAGSSPVEVHFFSRLGWVWSP